MRNAFNNKIIKPCFYSCANIITNINKEFLDLTEYAFDELLGKSLIEIGELLKINSQILLHNIFSEYIGYIFTKSLSSREVTISLLHDDEINQDIYTFIEIPNSRLDDKLSFVEHTFIDNILGAAVYSVPHLILLKANQKYLDFMDSPFNKEETSIGRPIREIITGFVESQSEDIWNTILTTQNPSYVKEFEFDKFERGITYWDATREPIFGKVNMKYIFETVTDVTQRVFKNQSIVRQHKVIMQQNKLDKEFSELISVIENLSEGILLMNNKGRFLMINSEAKRLVYKYDVETYIFEALKNTKMFDMKGNEIPLNDFPSVRALRGEKIKNAKIFISHPNNEYFMEISSTPIYNTNGNLHMVVTCFHDITETINQSRKIEDHKNELEGIIENLAESISIFDNKGQFILFNKAARQRCSPSYRNLEGIDDIYNKYGFYDVLGNKIDPENIPARRIMRGEGLKNVRISIKFPHETLQKDISGTPIYDSKGNFSLGVLCSRDMTDYYKREKSIRSRFEILNRIIDTFDLPVVRLSCPDLKIVDINKKGFGILKLIKPDVTSIDQIKNTNIKYLFNISISEEYYDCINDVLKEKKTKYLNKKHYFIDNKDIYWNIIFEPVLEINEEIQEILILIIDITPEINSNIVMEKALKLQGEFLVNISHELKTPLNVIFSTTQLFDMYCNKGSLDENKDSIIKYIDSIKQNTYRLSKMINNIVDLSKIEAGFFKLNLSSTNIVEFVEAIVMSVTHFTDSKGLNIVFDTDTEDTIMACDTDKIERVVLNLISNAIKFTDKGGELIVAVKDKIEFVEISVKDNGIGIEDKYLDMIFDRFKQVDKSLSRNAEGTGIGLSLVKSISELHGGTVSVKSEFGKGSKFTVSLPFIKILQENTIYNSEVRSEDQIIQVELSDVYS